MQRALLLVAAIIFKLFAMAENEAVAALAEQFSAASGGDTVSEQMAITHKRTLFERYLLLFV